MKRKFAFFFCFVFLLKLFHGCQAICVCGGFRHTGFYLYWGSFSFVCLSVCDSSGEFCFCQFSAWNMTVWNRKLKKWRAPSYKWEIDPIKNIYSVCVCCRDEPKMCSNFNFCSNWIVQICFVVVHLSVNFVFKISCIIGKYCHNMVVTVRAARHHQGAPTTVYCLKIVFTLKWPSTSVNFYWRRLRDRLLWSHVCKIICFIVISQMIHDKVELKNSSSVFGPTLVTVFRTWTDCYCAIPDESGKSDGQMMDSFINKVQCSTCSLWLNTTHGNRLCVFLSWSYVMFTSCSSERFIFPCTWYDQSAFYDSL